MKKMEEFAGEYLKELSTVLLKLDHGAIARAIACVIEAEKGGRTIFACGNGGSSSVASQLVVDLVKGASVASGRRFKAMALTDSIPTVTAYANDVSYDAVFVEPLKVLGEKGDVLIAISGSGNSANILRAVEYANGAGIATIGLTTATGGRLKDLAQIAITVPSEHMGRLEDAFFAVTHVLCYAAMGRE